MSDTGDTSPVLHRMISDDQADRLLAGASDVDGDGGLAPVAGLLAALRGPAASDELDGAERLVAQMVDVVRDGGTTHSHTRRKPVLVRLISGKVVALAAASLLSAGAAAAATGTLPDPVQRGVSNTFSHIGVDLPSPDDHPSAPVTTDAPTDESTPTTRPGTPVGPDAAGPAMRGLCTAYLAGGGNGKNLDSVAMRNLQAAADEAGKDITGYCTPDSSTSTPTTPPQNGTAPGEPGRPSDPGRPSVPGSSGSTPAATAPRGSDASTPGSSGSTPAASAPGSNPSQPTTPERGSSGSTPASSAPADPSHPSTPSSPTVPSSPGDGRGRP